MKQHFRLRLSPSPSAASYARAFLARELKAWGMAELVEDAGLVVTELVANAAMHAGAISTFEVRVDGGGVRVEVSDPSRDLPVLRDPLADLESLDPEDVGGRGLLLVDSLARKWGADRHDGGKTVWAWCVLPQFEAEFRRRAYGTVVRRYATFRSNATGLTALEVRARARLGQLPRVGDVDAWELIGIRRIDDDQDAGGPAGGDQ